MSIQAAVDEQMLNGSDIRASEKEVCGNKGPDSVTIEPNGTIH